MIIFESILTPFIASVIFKAAGAVMEIDWLEPKIKPPLQFLTKLSLFKYVIHTVEVDMIRN